MPTADLEYDPDIDEPELLNFVRGYWSTQRGAAPMPSRQAISPARMKAYLPHILLVDVIAKGEDFRYRLVGGELQRYFARNPTGMSMSEALASFGRGAVARTLDTYREVVARRAPLRIRGNGTIYSQEAKVFDALLTPLSDNGSDVNMIFGTFVFAWNIHAAERARVIVEPDENALAWALNSAS